MNSLQQLHKHELCQRSFCSSQTYINEIRRKYQKAKINRRKSSAIEVGFDKTASKLCVRFGYRESRETIPVNDLSSLPHRDEMRVFLRICIRSNLVKAKKQKAFSFFFWSNSFLFVNKLLLMWMGCVMFLFGQPFFWSTVFLVNLCYVTPERSSAPFGPFLWALGPRSINDGNRQFLITHTVTSNCTYIKRGKNQNTQTF